MKSIVLISDKAAVELMQHRLPLLHKRFERCASPALTFRHITLLISSTMINEQEQKLVAKFVIKAKQGRYLAFLSKVKTRHKFTEELYHFRDFNWNLFREIPGSESERKTVAAEVNKRKISTCYVISVDAEYDGKFVPVTDAVEDVIGVEGTILIFGDLGVIYYEGEAPSSRYISK